MTPRLPRAAKALLALTAAGFLLSGCYYYGPYGGPRFGPPGHGYYGKGYGGGDWRHHDDGGWHRDRWRGGRGWH